MSISLRNGVVPDRGNQSLEFLTWRKPTSRRDLGDHSCFAHTSWSYFSGPDWSGYQPRYSCDRDQRRDTSWPASSITAGGGDRSSAFGALECASLIFSYLLFGAAAKILTLQAADSVLLEPQDTAMVMLLGFAGLLVGTWLQQNAPTPRRSLLPNVGEPRLYLWLTIINQWYWEPRDSLSASVRSSPAKARKPWRMSGGSESISAVCSQYSVFFALYYAWSSGARRFLTHRLVLSILLLEVAIGIVSTSKERISAPIAFYILVGVLRYGWKDRRIWIDSPGVSKAVLVCHWPFTPDGGSMRWHDWRPGRGRYVDKAFRYGRDPKRHAHRRQLPIVD